MAERSACQNKVSIADLMLFHGCADGAIDELGACRNTHISFGPICGPRTGYITTNSKLSIVEFQREAWLAFQWPMHRVLKWLDTNCFPPVFKRAFMELKLQGHSFFQLQRSMEIVRWQLNQPGYAGEWNGMLDSEIKRCEKLVGKSRMESQRDWEES